MYTIFCFTYVLMSSLKSYFFFYLTHSAFFFHLRRFKITAFVVAARFGIYLFIYIYIYIIYFFVFICMYIFIYNSFVSSSRSVPCPLGCVFHYVCVEKQNSVTVWNSQWFTSALHDNVLLNFVSLRCMFV